MDGKSKYIDAALAVFQELGVESMSTRDLVRAAQERGLVDNAKWTYHNMSRKVRECELFDTSGRGRIRLLNEAEVKQGVVEEVDPTTPGAILPGTDPVLTNPGPTLGNTVTAQANIVVTQTKVEASTGDENPDEFAREDFETST